MKKRQKNTLNADLIALLASIRDQIDDSFDEFGVEPDDENGDCDPDDSEEDDDD